MGLLTEYLQVCRHKGEKMFARYVVLLTLLVHGIAHLTGFLTTWTNEPMEFMAPANRAFSLLWLVALIAFMGTAFGLLRRQGWWRGLAINAAMISMIAIFPAWFSVTPLFRFPAVLINLVIFAALIPRWGDRVSAALKRYY